jgi:hypothetical protein
MKSKESIVISANWHHAVLSSANVVKPDTSRSWYDTDCVFMPANINTNHWILFCYSPKTNAFAIPGSTGKATSTWHIA